jgi:predicted dehydrogenase
LFHKEQVEKAAKAGKHILLEKPMGITLTEALEIESICNGYGVKLGVGFMMRFNSIHEKLKDIIEDGTLGEIVSIRTQFTCWYPEIEDAWRQKLATSGGGALMDMGIHCIDLIRFITGMEIVEVTAFTTNQIFSYEVESAASVIMRMDNGALAYVDAAFNIPDDATICKLEVYGTAGSAVIEGSLGQEESGEAVLIVSENTSGYNAKQNRVKAHKTKLLADSGNLYTKEIAAFADAIINNGKIPVPSSDAIAAQKVVESAYFSADKRCAVTVQKEI